MSKKSRVDTLQVLVSGHSTMRTSALLADILGELNRVVAVERLAKHNGWLLKVLHTTRALDTSLSEVINRKGWNPHNAVNSLGGYLQVLAKNNVITWQQRTDYQSSVVDKRNEYMHVAGAMPDGLVANKIYNEMHACLALVLANVS